MVISQETFLCQIWTWDTLVSSSSEIEAIVFRESISTVDLVYISSRCVLADFARRQFSISSRGPESRLFTGATVYSRVAANGTYPTHIWGPS